jgi:TM2 domain
MEGRVSDRSLLASLFLAVLGGLFGFHRLYLGHRSTGLLQLALSTGGMLGIALLYWFNYNMFNTNRVDLVAISSFLRVLGVMLAVTIPILLVASWVLFDVVQLMLYQFKDSDGHQVRRWISSSVF